jgi:hypothetical protein
MRYYAITLAPHELAAMHELVAYARAIAKTFPDREGDQFATKLASYAKILEEVVVRAETTGG